MGAFGGPPEPVRRVEQIRIPRPDGSEIQGQLYIPDPAAPVPVMVYLHGGGWALGNHMAVDSPVRALANRSGCAMLAIDYRLSPEHKYPAALDDVHRTLQWIAENATGWGLDPLRVAVGGDSSGANLSTAVSLLCRDQGGPPIAFQLLVYPVLDHIYETDSYQRFGDGTLSALSRADVAWFHSLYINDPAELDLPYVSPLRAENLVGLPRTLLIAAELDPLTQEGLEYARRLEQAGVPVEKRVYPGMFHGFWWMPGVLAEAREAIEYVSGKIREALM